MQAMRYNLLDSVVALNMASFVNPPALAGLAWGSALVVLGLNSKLVFDQIGDWREAGGHWGWLIAGVRHGLEIPILAVRRK
jgi:hypothetical protein